MQKDKDQALALILRRVRIRDVSYVRVDHDLAETCRVWGSPSLDEPLSRCGRHLFASEGVQFLGGISPRNPQKFPNPKFSWLIRLTGPSFKPIILINNNMYFLLYNTRKSYGDMQYIFLGWNIKT